MVGFITSLIFTAALTTSILLIDIILRHSQLISRGVTSVERLLHRDYAQQCAKKGYVFVNPYDFGLLKNWKRFFNVRT